MRTLFSINWSSKTQDWESRFLAIFWKIGVYISRVWGVWKLAKSPKTLQIFLKRSQEWYFCIAMMFWKSRKILQHPTNTPRTIPITFYCVVIVATIPYLANIRWAYRLLPTTKLKLTTTDDWSATAVSRPRHSPQWTMTNTVSELPVNMCDLC